MKHIRKYLFVWLVLPLMIAGAFGLAHAQNQIVPDEPELIKPPENQAPATSEPVKPSVAEDRLIELFSKLKRQTRPGPARATANLIWMEWLNSGSDTINLLMSRAGKAIEEKKYGLAADLLDQVIVLRPDYAEAWNRRATFYFVRQDFSRSLADIQATLRLEPRHFGALSGLAAILMQLGRDEEALDTWYRVLEIYPANQAAQKAVITLEEKLTGKPI